MTSQQQLGEVQRLAAGEVVELGAAGESVGQEYLDRGNGPVGATGDS
jgi:hypothetical protein